MSARDWFMVGIIAVLLCFRAAILDDRWTFWSALVLYAIAQWRLWVIAGLGTKPRLGD